MQRKSDGNKLLEMVKKAIDDLEVTTTEYAQIMELAARDSHIDAEESAILAQFQEMLADRTIKRIPG